MPMCHRCAEEQDYALPKHGPTPEPHFIPGYTGFCPELTDQIGMSYPWATYAVLRRKPELAMRLSATTPKKRGIVQARIVPHSCVQNRTNEDFQPQLIGNDAIQKEICKKMMEENDTQRRKMWNQDENQHDPCCFS